MTRNVTVGNVPPHVEVTSPGCALYVPSAVAGPQVNRRLNRLIVVDGHGRLAGVCSRGDIMRATLEHFRWSSVVTADAGRLLSCRARLLIQGMRDVDVMRCNQNLSTNMPHITFARNCSKGNRDYLMRRQLDCASSSAGKA